MCVCVCVFENQVSHNILERVDVTRFLEGRFVFVDPERGRVKPRHKTSVRGDQSLHAVHGGTEG